ncbi:YdcH family protein, partial [Shewanella indica]|uniref:YdcH family protein n=1 Tax=Shewanella indica TaxID=768528 RepID=UPI001C056C65
MFPEYRDLITSLKNSDSHFQKLFDEHNLLDKEIKNKEQQLSSEFTQEVKEMKKRKLELKEQ